MTAAAPTRLLNWAVVVAALGYFVDIYDLVLFGVVRVASLKDIGVPESELLSTGVFLLNMQMAGMLLGGVLWGMLGDKKGRLSVLFGSILMYSLANLANAFVTSVEMYAVLRFIAGIGLAGELGAAITLVCEVMPKEKRGAATAIVAGFGVSGAILAATVGQLVHWSHAYIIGGVMGLALLVLRVRLAESGLFHRMGTHHTAPRGNFLMLLYPAKRLKTYLACILIGVPIWFVIGILATFAPELGKALNATGPLVAAQAIMYAYIGLVGGDFASGFLSQYLKSRRKVVALFMASAAGLTALFLLMPGMDPSFYYILYVLLGFSAGYWAVFVTIGAEQFGTNLRATAATTIPNMVRGSTVALTTAFTFFKGHLPLDLSALLVGAFAFAIGAAALWRLKETFHADLDFLEHK
jgi:putative MFS transporter